jgi:hypothetical protein
MADRFVPQQLSRGTIAIKSVNKEKEKGRSK